MLVRLTPEQVAHYWIDVLKESIRNSLPAHINTSDDSMNVILSNILMEKLQCWVYRKGTPIVAVSTTAIVTDELSGTVNFLLYSLFATQSLAEEDYVEAYNTVIRYAKAKGCDRVYAYTSNERVARMAKMIGADVQMLCSFPTITKN